MWVLILCLHPFQKNPTKLPQEREHLLEKYQAAALRDLCLKV